MGTNYNTKEEEWNNIISVKDGLIMDSENQTLSLTSQLENLKCEFDEVMEEKIGITTALAERESELTKCCVHFQTLEEELGDLRMVIGRKDDELTKLRTQIDMMQEGRPEDGLHVPRLDAKKISTSSTISTVSLTESLTNEVDKLSDI